MGVLLSLLLLLPIHGQPLSEPKVQIVKFSDLEPKLHLDDGHTWIINFWATWCAPCVKEMPYFQKIANDYAEKGVRVLFVSLDFVRQVDSRVIPFLINKKITSEVIVLNDPNANAWIDKVNPEWTGSLPATLIYKGQYRRFYEQEFSYEELLEAVNEVLIK